MRFIILLDVPQENLKGFVDGWRGRRPEGVKVLLRPHVSGEPLRGASCLTVVESNRMGSVMSYCKALEAEGAKVQLVPVYDDKSTSRELERFSKSKKQAERHNRKKVRRLKNLGSTRRLEVLPLIDWRAVDEGLKVETGVSYLVRTDGNTILFDVGLNADEEDPSPLLQNMGRLGVSLSDVDTVFITHNHGDHTGGGKWSKKRTFSVTGRQVPLGDVKVYTSTEMTYPGLEPVYARDPLVIGTGVASTGTIANSMYFWGFTEEHSLAVNVEGKGIVLIVGCGHHTVPLLLERAKVLFDQPVYGLVGGLHFPVMGGPSKVYGFAGHKYVGTGKPPWDHLTVDELQANIKLLQGLNLGLVALSPHDSSELSIQAFRSAFPDAYVDLRVGEPIIVG
jgi:7,8-dihydropterin-6-yl-methyl-4-(beta-D-ribofuranosyl)aminobenzene 5'-phosphate synthase